MKISHVALAATFALSSAAGLTAANAAQNLANPDLCVAEIAKLDVNNDGYVDNNEASKVFNIDKNVDTDGDGQISQEEKVVACENGAIDALEQDGPA